MREEGRSLRGRLGRLASRSALLGEEGDVVGQAQAAHSAVQRGQPAVVLAAPAHPAPIPLGLFDPVQTDVILERVGAHIHAVGMGAAWSCLAETAAGDECRCCIPFSIVLSLSAWYKGAIRSCKPDFP